MLVRHCQTLVRDSLGDFPAVLLLGARQVGKSTLAQQLVSQGVLDRYVTLDDLAALEAATRDPDGFLESFGDRVAIDEVQRVPDLMRALKKSIDRRRQPGRYLLTGSANVLSRRGVTESLAGRVDIISLEGFSRAEINGLTTPPARLQALLLDPDWRHATQELQPKPGRSVARADLRRHVFFGGFPEVVLKREGRFAARWFAAYMTTYVERDVRDLARLPDIVAFGRFLRLAAQRSGQLLNIKSLGADCGIDQRTAASYLHLLEVTFQMERLAPWQASARKRLVKTPKIFVLDSGLACHLNGISRPEDLEDHPSFGALAETWARAELRKHASLLTGPQWTFYRTHQGREVDFVLEQGRHRLGIELKLTTSLSRSDFAGLLDMQEAFGRNARGVLLYLGSEVVSIGDGLIAMPLDQLL